MTSSKAPRRIRWRRMVALIALSGALAAGWLLRDCVELGLGGGGTPGLAPGEKAPEPPSAQAPADAVPARPCELYLDSGGLTLDGDAVRIDEAVRACRKAGKARLRATGGARAGTYDALMSALDQAGVAVERD